MQSRKDLTLAEEIGGKIREGGLLEDVGKSLHDPPDSLVDMVYSRNTIPGSEPIVSGFGASFTLRNGRFYVDLCSQTLNLNLGQCHPVVLAALQKLLPRLTYTSSRYSNPAVEVLARKLIEITPPNLCAVNLKCVSGSDANECALKAVRKKSGCMRVVSMIGSHHGQTCESMRISGKNFDLPYLGERQAHFAEPPYCFRCPVGKHPDSCAAECLDAVEKELTSGPEPYAAVFIEPVMVDAGVFVPPRIYHQRLRKICTEAGVALVFDEVQTAFGWLGRMFAMEYYGVQPDVVTLAKGLGAGFPIGAVLFSREYDVLEYGEHEITYGAHPFSATASLAMIDCLLGGELAEVQNKESFVHQRLAALQERFPVIGDVRGMGLLWGIEIVNPRTGDSDQQLGLAIFREMQERGYLLRVSKVGKNSNVLQLKPPLVITYEQLEGFFETFARVLEDIT
jgi:4-aminobutyrate aminotransferase-like enzyme